MHRIFARTAVTGVCLSAILLTSSAPLPGEEPLLWPRQEGDGDSPRRVFHDPYLPIQAQKLHVEPEFLELWLEALALPETDLKREAALAIARAHRSGWLDCSSAAEPLLAALQENDNRLVQAEFARTLITIDARQAVPALQQRLKEGAHFARLVEPALADWGGETMRDVWLQRLASRADMRRFELLLAIRCLGTVREARAIEPLTDIVRRSKDFIVRLESARSLGMIQRSGLEPFASELSTDTASRLLAARLLRLHDSAEAVKQMFGLCSDREPGVATPALERLLELDVEHVIPIAESMLVRRDSRLRELTVAALAEIPTLATVAVLDPVLGDLNPDIRRLARRTLFQFAQEETLRNAVLAVAEGHLGSGDWHAIEQSAILLGELKHTPAGVPLFNLVKVHKNAKVCLASAWGVSMVEDPQLLPEILELVEQERGTIMAGEGTSLSNMNAIAHLIETLGRMQYRPADTHLRKWIPTSLTDPKPTDGRSSALWALGKIFTDEPDAGLSASIMQRINDPNEAGNVRYAGIIAMGWMKSEAAIEKLQPMMFAPISDYFSYAVAWADNRATGKPIPPLNNSKKNASDWFLIPTDARRQKRDE